MSQFWLSSCFDEGLQFHPGKKGLRIKRGKKPQQQPQNMEEFLFEKRFPRLGHFTLGKRSEELLQKDEMGAVAP